VAVLARTDDIEASWLLSGLDDAFALVAGRFGRREVRARARACLTGMLSELGRKTGWSLAEHGGERSPDGMQRLFATATTGKITNRQLRAVGCGTATSRARPFWRNLLAGTAMSRAWWSRWWL
jgi:hypothetical protein